MSFSTASAVSTISTHAPAGGATAHRTSARSCGFHFYSRPCGRGDSARRAAATSSPAFLLTPLREGRHNRIPNRMMVSYFYSRPCGRGDVRTFTRNHIIHVISTHAPAGGATPRAGTSVRCTPYFYSRPCGRGDVRTYTRNPIIHVISTHAPAGGATPRAGKSVRCTPYFYSRPCGRGDVILRLTILINQ